jgi:sortase, SrtB family
MKAIPKRKWFAWFFLVAGVVAIITSAARLIPMFQENSKAAQGHSALREIIARTNRTPPPFNPVSLAPAVSAMDFEQLTTINKDCIAWLTVADTVIDYPVVQGEDNEFYLTTGFDGAPLRAGALFVDYKANPLFEGLNHPIYGHSMRDESMFRALESYLDADFAKAHTDMILYTPQGDWRLVPFSVYIAPSAGDYHTEPTDEKDAHARALEWHAKSKVNFEVVPQADDRFVTLITCTSDTGNNLRVVLHAILYR